MTDTAAGLRRTAAVLVVLAAGSAAGPLRAATVYRCPGPPVLYTDAYTAAEAKRLKCSPIRNAPITVITSPVRLTPAPQVNLNEVQQQTQDKVVGGDRPASTASRERAPARSPAPKSAGAGAGSRPGFYADGDARVPSTTQQNRDKDARMILESELQRETAALDALRAQLAGGQLPLQPGETATSPAYQQRLAELKTRVARHENDVRAITKELERLRR
ncbi:hypothetical protein [Amphibiibacter pelophylacis]|uniref:Uncharacterized protein n=1 Tax=Amphibiibacter pelophylacis TaxID=1799477 RepID=A0ACC6P526_9BURK